MVRFGTSCSVSTRRPWKEPSAVRCKKNSASSKPNSKVFRQDHQGNQTLFMMAQSRWTSRTFPRLEMNVLATMESVSVVGSRVTSLGTAKCLCLIGKRHRARARTTTTVIMVVGSIVPKGQKTGTTSRGGASYWAREEDCECCGNTGLWPQCA